MLVRALLARAPMAVFQPAEVPLKRLLPYSKPTRGHIRSPALRDEVVISISLKSGRNVIICCHVYWAFLRGASSQAGYTANFPRPACLRGGVSRSPVADFFAARPGTCSRGPRYYQSA